MLVHFRDLFEKADISQPSHCLAAHLGIGMLPLWNKQIPEFHGKPPLIEPTARPESNV
jgi:hypothetical protein